MRECPSCAVDVEDNLSVCPVCGYEFPQKKSWPRWIAFILLLLSGYVTLRILLSYLS